MTTPVTDIVDYALWAMFPTAAVALAARLYGDATGGRGISMGSSGLTPKDRTRRPTDLTSEQRMMWAWSIPKPRGLLAPWLMLFVSLLLGWLGCTYGTWRIWRTLDATNNTWLAAMGLSIFGGAFSFLWPYTLLKWRSVRGAVVSASLTTACVLVCCGLFWTLYVQGTGATAVTPYEISGPLLYSFYAAWVAYGWACMVALAISESRRNPERRYPADKTTLKMKPVST